MIEYVKMFEVRKVSDRKSMLAGSEWTVTRTDRGTALKIVNREDWDDGKRDRLVAAYRDQFELMEYNVGIFVKVLRWGFEPRPWIETDWLDTDRVFAEFDSMFVAISENRDADDYAAQERIYDMLTWPEEDRDPDVSSSVRKAMESAGLADLFARYYDMSVACREITGKKILDLHEGNWGYDSHGFLKIFDY